MYNHLFTYSLTILLLFSIVTPTIMSLSDYDICETSLLLDIEEETDSKEKSEEIKELKIISFPLIFTSTYPVTSRKFINTYKKPTYPTIYRSLESPPPEFY